ncbi:MAG: type II/IV secretion system ATPase subunit [Candidatus Aenigmarchaeota archaeon]|nr:type II/IV secretion system ATPase subunit [Candidatus Aenigmarchaeota archaeon]
MIRLHSSPKRINLYKVFSKAVIGYKELENQKKKERYGMPKDYIPYPMQAPAINVEKLEAKKLEEDEKSSSILERTTVNVREPEIDIKGINIVYTLIPSSDRTPFASANIKWSRRETGLVYYLQEPILSDEEKKLLNNIKLNLIEKLDVDFTSLRKGEAKGFLLKKFEDTIELMAAELPPSKRKDIFYYIQRDFVGLDKIEALMQDPNIEDISCDGVGIPLYVFHRNPIIGSIRTNVVFDDKEELDTFVSKVAQRCGKNISIANPLIGGSLPDGSRVQATLGTDIARKGSNFTIRKFTKKPLTPVNLINFKSMDPKIAAYLWLAVEHGRSVLVSGGVATGKTTILNAMSLFIRPELKIVSIEDTAELVLPHPHWVPGVARTAITEVEGKKIGEVDLFDLLRESLRQRPDYLIVGEVRGKEAYVLFQQIATGHPSMSTIHADSMERLIDRLTTPPIELPASLIETLDIVVFVVRMKYGQSYIRRIKSIYEVLGFDRDKNIPIVNEVFKWDPVNDGYKQVNKSNVLEKISMQFGIKQSAIDKQIENRTRVMKWMVDNKISDYIDVAKIIKLYYTREQDLLDEIR